MNFRHFLQCGEALDACSEKVGDFNDFSACEDSENQIERPATGGNGWRKPSENESLADPIANPLEPYGTAHEFALQCSHHGLGLAFAGGNDGPMRFRDHLGGLEVFAPAKLNLFLEVLGRRPDGYHELETLMVAVNLFDKLTIQEDEPDRITFTCDDPTLPTGSDNLAVKAAERLKARTGCSRGVSIHLEKAIPSQAGLAGGSSDAASTLAALDKLWELHLSKTTLNELAAELGSDVAFFLDGEEGATAAAVCRGRGEKVERIGMKGVWHFVLIRPMTGISTADVYRNLQLTDEKRLAAPTLDALSKGDGSTERLGRTLFNRLQSTAERLHPEILQVRQGLDELVPSHLDGHLLSGSGSAYFGLARGNQAAKDAAQRLESLGLGWVRVVSCGNLSNAENAS